MNVTAKDITRAALKLLGKVNQKGAVEENKQSVYFGLAPAYLTQIQYEIAVAENKEMSALTPVTGLDSVLMIDDVDAQNVAPSGLAYLFASYDHDADMYAVHSQNYHNNLLPSIKPAEVDFDDYYGVRLDTDLITSE